MASARATLRRTGELLSVASFRLSAPFRVAGLKSRLSCELDSPLCLTRRTCLCLCQKPKPDSSRVRSCGFGIGQLAGLDGHPRSSRGRLPSSDWAMHSDSGSCGEAFLWQGFSRHEARTTAADGSSVSRLRSWQVLSMWSAASQEFTRCSGIEPGRLRCKAHSCRLGSVANGSGRHLHWAWG